MFSLFGCAPEPASPRHPTRPGSACSDARDTAWDRRAPLRGAGRWRLAGGARARQPDAKGAFRRSRSLGHCRPGAARTRLHSRRACGSLGPGKRSDHASPARGADSLRDRAAEPGRHAARGADADRAHAPRPVLARRDAERRRRAERSPWAGRARAALGPARGRARRGRARHDPPRAFDDGRCLRGDDASPSGARGPGRSRRHRLRAGHP